MNADKIHKHWPMMIQTDDQLAPNSNVADQRPTTTAQDAVHTEAQAGAEAVESPGAQHMADYVVIDERDAVSLSNCDVRVAEQSTDKESPKPEASAIDVASDTEVEDVMPADSTRGVDRDANLVSQRVCDVSDPTTPEQICDRIDTLEHRLRRLERTTRRMSVDMDTVSERDEDIRPGPRRLLPTIPELHRVNWLDFKHKRFNEQQDYAIEVLVGGAKYFHERRLISTKGRDHIFAEKHETSDFEPPKGVPDRIRINSEPVLSILSEITGATLSRCSLVLLHPFKMLVHHDHEIREALTKLREKWSEVESQDLLARNDHELTKKNDAGTPKESTATTEERDRLRPKNTRDSVEAFKDLRCLVQFMDEDLRPIVDHYSSDSCQTVRFADLWYLFNPGDEVFAPGVGSPEVDIGDVPDNTNPKNPGDKFPSHVSRRTQIAYRVFHAGNGRRNLCPADLEVNVCAPEKEKPNSFVISCYYIEFTGTRFGPVRHNFLVRPFEGEKKITSLEVFPSRFAKNAAEVRDKLMRRGEQFLELTTGAPHKHFAGWTRELHPCGCAIQGEVPPRKAEYLDSPVVVNFAEPYKKFIRWFQQFGPMTSCLLVMDEQREDYPVAYWKDVGDSKPHYYDEECVHEDYKVDDHRMDALVAREPILDMDNYFYNKSQLHGDMLILLPSRVFAFVLKLHRIAMIGIEDLAPVKWIRPQEVSLPVGHLETLQALVKVHLKKKPASTTSLGYEIETCPTGKGLVVLLHGVPGNGKTSTAEAIAATHERLLQPINIGDIDPNDFEESFLNYLRLTSRYNLIPLLSGIETIVAPKRHPDLEHDSNAAVFLRILATYPGLLFLESAGPLKSRLVPGFRSCIHLALHFPALTRPQTERIWTAQFDTLSMFVDQEGVLEWALQRFDGADKDQAKWSARQIANAVQTAAMLAEAEADVDGEEDGEGDGDGDGDGDALSEGERRHVVLERRHFEVIAAGDF